MISPPLSPQEWNTTHTWLKGQRGMAGCELLAIPGPEKYRFGECRFELQTRFSENFRGECRRKGLFLVGLLCKILNFKVLPKILRTDFIESPTIFIFCHTHYINSPTPAFFPVALLSLSYLFELKRNIYINEGYTGQKKVPHILKTEIRSSHTFFLHFTGFSGTFV